jgi:hypothetical protein
LRRSSVAWLVFLSIATSIGSLSVSRFRFEDGGLDITHYVKIHEGTPLEEIPPPYRYRLLTPVLARAVPALPPGLMERDRRLDDKVPLFKFAVVNLLGLATAAWFLMRMMDTMGFGPWQAFCGGLLFLGSHFPLTTATLPVTDAWAYAYLVGCLYGLLTRRHVLVAVLFGLGVFTKETVLIAPLAALLLPQPRGTRIAQLCAFLPGALAYLVFRVFLYPPELGLYSVESASKFAAEVFGRPDRFAFYMSRAAMAFGVLWIVAAYGFALNRRRTEHPLIRWSWLAPAILAVPFVLALNVAKVWFFSFPIVIPLAVWGLERCFEGTSRS